MSFLRSFLPILLCAAAHGAVRHEVTTDGWTGSGETNSWQFADLAVPYRQDGQSVAIQFAKGGATVISPDYPDVLVAVELQLRSSVNPLRQLTLTPLRNGTALGTSVELEPPNAERPTVRAVTIARRLGANGIRLELGAGSSGNWGLYGLALICAKANEVAEPFALEDRTDGSHTLKATWQNREEVVACEFRAVTTNAIPASAQVRAAVSLACLTNATRQSRDVTRLLTETVPELSGQRLYTPPGSTGVVMVGASDYPGILAYRPRQTLDGLSLHLCVRRYPSRDEGNVMPIDWTDGTHTNVLTVLRLTDDSRDHFTALSGLPADTQILIHSSTNRSTASGANGRIIVSALGLASDVVPTHIETNELVRLGCTGTSLHVTGLEPGTVGLWSVRGLDNDGNASPFAPYVPFATSPVPRAGTWMHLK